MNFADLHIHSTYSDGMLTPEEIITNVVNKALPGFSLTDHDTFEGIKSIYEYIKNKNINTIFIAGCEFSSYHPEIGEVHILGYFRYDDIKNIENFTEEFRSQRIGRAKKIIDCLKANGYTIDEEKIFANSKVVGRLNIARELVERGFFKNITEAFDKMLRSGSPCYVKKKEVLPETVIEKITKANGKAVLAHPTFLSSKKHWEIIHKWKNLGLFGIECFHPKIDFKLANEIIDNFKNDFFLTGGSDFHGDDEKLEIGQYGISKENLLEFYEYFSDKK